MYDSDVEALVLEMMKELGIKLTTPLKDQIRSTLTETLGRPPFYKDHLVVIGREDGKCWYRIFSPDMRGPDEPAQVAVPAKYFSDSKEQAFEEAKKRIDKKLF